MVECFPSLGKILGLSPYTKRSKRKQRKEQSHQCVLLQFLSCLNQNHPPWPPVPLSSRLLDTFDLWNIMYLVLANTSKDVPASASVMSHVLGSGCAHIWHFPSYWPCAHSLAWPLSPRQGPTSCQSFLTIVFSITELTRLQPRELNHDDSRNPDPFHPTCCCFSMIRKARYSPGLHLHITSPTFASNSSPQMPFPRLSHSNLAHRYSDPENHIA